MELASSGLSVLMLLGWSSRLNRLCCDAGCGVEQNKFTNRNMEERVNFIDITWEEFESIFWWKIQLSLNYANLASYAILQDDSSFNIWITQHVDFINLIRKMAGGWHKWLPIVTPWYFVFPCRYYPLQGRKLNTYCKVIKLPLLQWKTINPSCTSYQ